MTMTVSSLCDHFRFSFFLFLHASSCVWCNIYPTVTITKLFNSSQLFLTIHFCVCEWVELDTSSLYKDDHKHIASLCVYVGSFFFSTFFSSLLLLVFLTAQIFHFFGFTSTIDDAEKNNLKSYTRVQWRDNFSFFFFFSSFLSSSSCLLTQVRCYDSLVSIFIQISNAHLNSLESVENMSFFFIFIFFFFLFFTPFLALWAAIIFLALNLPSFLHRFDLISVFSFIFLFFHIHHTSMQLRTQKRCYSSKFFYSQIFTTILTFIFWMNISLHSMWK